jgi:hypothetical protein
VRGPSLTRTPLFKGEANGGVIHNSYRELSTAGTPFRLGRGYAGPKII